MPRKPPIVSDGIDPDNIDVLSLLEQTRFETRGGFNCWASKADGKLKEFLDGCTKRIEQGVPFSMIRALEIAQQNFGVRVKISAFRNHIMGRCSCKKNYDS